MATMILVVLCACALAFMIRFLIALRQEASHSVVCHAVPLQRRTVGAETIRSQVQDLRVVLRSRELDLHRRRPSVA